jgi:hypothetical protein
MKKIKKIIMNNYKVFIPIILLLVIFLAFTIYYLVSNKLSLDYVETGSYYQYFNDNKFEYEANITKDKSNVIKNIEPIDRYISYDSTPMYSKDGNTVIFPSDMSLVAPILNISEYLAKANSYIKFENNRYSLITNKFNQYLGHYFFFDGDSLYFFVEDITLVVNNDKIELGPFSYVIADGNNISYYDKVNDTYKSIIADSYQSYVDNDYYTIYISNDYIDYYGRNVVLTSDLSVLSTVDEMKRVTSE